MERDPLVARHVDAIRSLLGVQSVICLIVAEYSGELMLVCPNDVRAEVFELMDGIKWMDSVP